MNSAAEALPADSVSLPIQKRLSAASLQVVESLATVNPLRSVMQYLLVYLAIAFIITSAIWLNHWAATLLAIFLISARQHSLYILNHDASHSALFKRRGLNRWWASIFSNFVMFHHPEAWSFVQWRRVHLHHHQGLFTEQDPNYVGRRMQGDTERSYTGGQLLLTSLRGAPNAWRDFLVGRQDYVAPGRLTVEKGKYAHLRTLFKAFNDDAEMEQERRWKWVFFITTIALMASFNVLDVFLLYWMLPMYTVYPMILRFHDISEHNWHVRSLDLNENTRSRHPGWISGLFLSYLPRGYHREHHVFPRVCVTNLPNVSQLLVKEGLVERPIKNLRAFLSGLAKYH